MMPAQVLPHEVRDLQARLPRWLGPFTNWSARFANCAPRWLPRSVRMVPLNLACAVVALYVRGWL
jgi:hypothetical protein